MSPAISRTLVDLGLGDLMVGRTPFCWAVDATVPVAGDLTHVDFERLVRLSPTHVLMQPPATGLDPRLSTLAREQGWTLATWPRLDRARDVARLLEELPPLLFPRRGDRYQRAAGRARARLAELRTALEPRDPPVFPGRVLLLAAVDPPMAFGRETYLHDLMSALGARNAVQRSGWIQLSLEDLVRLDPDAILVVVDREPARLTDEEEHLATLRGLDVSAAHSDRLAVLAHPDALLPSSAIAQVSGALRRRLDAMAAPRQ